MKFNREILSPIFAILGMKAPERNMSKAEAQRLYNYYLSASGRLSSRKPESFSRIIKAPSMAQAKASLA